MFIMNKGGEGMLKRIVQACFLITGGTLGILLIPELLTLLNMNDIPFINNSYVYGYFRCNYFLSYYVLGSRICDWIY